MLKDNKFILDIFLKNKRYNMKQEYEAKKHSENKKCS